MDIKIACAYRRKDIWRFGLRLDGGMVSKMGWKAMRKSDNHKWGLKSFLLEITLSSSWDEGHLSFSVQHSKPRGELPTSSAQPNDLFP